MRSNTPRIKKTHQFLMVPDTFEIRFDIVNIFKVSIKVIQSDYNQIVKDKIVLKSLDPIRFFSLFFVSVGL